MPRQTGRIDADLGRENRRTGNIAPNGMDHLPGRIFPRALVSFRAVRTRPMVES